MEQQVWESKEQRLDKGTQPSAVTFCFLGPLSGSLSAGTPS